MQDYWALIGTAADHVTQPCNQVDLPQHVPCQQGQGLQSLTSSPYSFIMVLLQRPHKATQEEMIKFHSDEYIKFLRSIRPDNMSEYNKQMQRCEWLLVWTCICTTLFYDGIFFHVFVLKGSIDKTIVPICFIYCFENDKTYVEKYSIEIWRNTCTNLWNKTLFKK